MTGVVGRAGRCWVAETLPGAGPCDGRLVRAHLIPKQRVRREVISARRGEGRTGWPANVQERALLYSIVWDERAWVWICGGPMGNGGHHGMLDGRQLEVPRAALPPELEEYAAEVRLGWSLDRDYGPRPARAETPIAAPLDPVGHMQAMQLRTLRRAR